MGKLTIKEFPDEFILECRMVMDPQTFDFWFLAQDGVDILGYLSSRFIGLSSTTLEHLKYEGERYIIFYSFTKNDRRMYFCSEGMASGFFKEITGDIAKRYMEALEQDL